VNELVLLFGDRVPQCRRDTLDTEAFVLTVFVFPVVRTTTSEMSGAIRAQAGDDE
jgi:hypothetical protein